MNWMSKNLTLDLLAITIDGLQKAFDRIANEPEEGNWPPADTPTPAAPEAAEEPTPLQQPDPDTPAEPAPEELPAAAQADTPGVDVDAWRSEAQNLLRAIVEHQDGVNYVTQTLFPKFGVQTLTDLDAGDYPALIEEARNHLAKQQEGGAAA